MNTATKQTINLPKASVGRLLDAMRFFELAQDEIEDFLVSNNKTIIAKIKKAHGEHLKGESKDFQNLLKKYVYN
ncbi:MAG: hypothetical protein HZB11_01930 [Candidatus Yonathbacteria bacterium]|nr:hypothetical protein [Candidatus Yonathbacteria bacterium]